MLQYVVVVVVLLLFLFSYSWLLVEILKLDGGLEETNSIVQLNLAEDVPAPCDNEIKEVMIMIWFPAATHPMRLTISSNAVGGNNFNSFCWHSCVVTVADGWDFGDCAMIWQ